MRGSVVLLAGVLGVGLLMGLIGTARAGDPDLAKFLLQHGRTALLKGDYDDALTKLRKARVEDPTLIEATYVIALVLERKKEPTKAVLEYRAFQLGAEAAQRDAKLSKKMSKFLKKAMGRLKALDAGNTEINKAQAAFATGLCISARAMASTDAGLAIRMLKVARAAAPDHNDARNMLDEMASGFIPLASVFDSVHDWQDVIKSSMLGKNPGWTYQGTKIAVTTLGGSLIRPPGGYESGPTYALTADLALKDKPSLQKTMTAGLLFGIAKDEGFAAIILQDEGKKDRLALSAMSLSPPKDRPLKIVNLPKWTGGTTHRVSVLVEGKRIRLFFDNELAIDHKVSGRDDLGGTIGVSFQNTTLDIKQFRVGKVVGGAK